MRKERAQYAVMMLILMIMMCIILLYVTIFTFKSKLLEIECAFICLAKLKTKENGECI